MKKVRDSGLLTCHICNGLLNKDHAVYFCEECRFLGTIDKEQVRRRGEFFRTLFAEPE